MLEVGIIEVNGGETIKEVQKVEINIKIFKTKI